MPIEELRSFAPAPGLERPMRTEPIDEHRPSLKTLARGHNDLHNCLEAAREDIAEIREALGVGEGRKRVAGLATQWGAFRRNVLATASSLVAVAVLYRIAVALAPLAWQALKTLNDMVLGVRI